MTHENETTEQPQGVAPTSVQTACLNVVEQYRRGQISKGCAIYEFTKSIPTGEDGAAESVGQTLESYVSMLDDSDRERTLSDACAPGVEEGANANPNETGQEQIHTEDGDDVECDEPVHKRPKIDPERFPWVIADKSCGTGLRDECVETRDLIANYSIDLKLAKAHLLNSGAAPEFPDSEWKSVLSGLAVNLDVVFSGRYSTEHEAKVTQEVGDFTISTRELSTSKTIKTAGDWFIAWNQTAAATAFAFPH